ncbi:DUF4403 family protein [Novosphingobium aerophilum]|uniref:DUF4403 family protein n=1 Tax=Novosphingobium TaxID=165696 RepID=UPI000AE473DF|nr:MULTISPECIES: DUF4403 family protein [unclassified Novosphingobium]TCM34465.1 uncharacterized protein DUF4403 [Novosphingobium sp. ST904]WRT92483.1 DUF4403 family protein [Novosphingobium sp. RL4]
MRTGKVRAAGHCAMGATTLALCLALALAGCKRRADEGPPPRATDAIRMEPQASLVTVPIHADVSELARALEREIPRRLWSIDRPDSTCVPSRKVKVAFVKLKTPDIKCRIIGEVTRGPVSFTGKGRDIVLTMPLHAVVRAEDIAGVLKRETATADATARATIRLTLAQDWTPRGTVDIRYSWTEHPHLDFLGQRIDLTEPADRKLAPVIARLETTLPGQLARLELRPQIERAWASAFTSLALNERNPPVWMRITPQELQYGGYELDGHRLVLRLGLKALTETFVGHRPPDPPAAPLPPLRPMTAEAGRLAFFIPVIADYRELEPVLMRALVKRSQRPFAVPHIGPVMATFHKATIYGTTGGRIAVGINFTARGVAERLKAAHGTVWITATPVNAANSRKVDFADFHVGGTTDAVGGDILLALANTPGVSSTLSAALGQNFENDYRDLLGKIARAIDDKREGEFVIRAEVTETHTGTIKASGRGLYLPVRAGGKTSITLRDKP